MNRMLLSLSVILVVLIGVFFAVHQYETVQQQKLASSVVQSYLEQLSSVSYKQNDMFTTANKYQLQSSLEMDNSNQSWFTNRIKEHKLIGQDVSGIKVLYKGKENEVFRMEGDAFYQMHSDKTNTQEVIQYSQDFYLSKQPNGTFLITGILPITAATIHR